MKEQSSSKKKTPQVQTILSLIYNQVNEPLPSRRKPHPNPLIQASSQFFNRLQSNITQIQYLFIDIRNNLVYKQQLRLKSIQNAVLISHNRDLKQSLKDREKQIQRMRGVIKDLQRKNIQIGSIQKIRNDANQLKRYVEEFRRQTIKQISNIREGLIKQILRLRNINIRKQVQRVVEKIPKSNEKELLQKISISNQQTQKMKRSLFQIYESVSYYMKLRPIQKNNFMQMLPQYQNNIINHLLTNYFLNQSQIITDFDSRAWLMSQIRSINHNFNESIISKLLCKYDKKNITNFHHYFDNIPNILILVKVINGYIIGGFTEYPFNLKKQKQSNGCLFNIRERCIFPMKEVPHCEVAKYDEYYFILGNSELRIKNGELKLFSNFGVSTSAFDNRGKGRKDFHGGSQTEIEIEGYEIYRLQ